MSSSSIKTTKLENRIQVYQAAGHASSALEMLARCWRQHPSLCDTVISLHDLQFHAHRAVLMACSEFFKDIYDSLPQGGRNPEVLGENILLSKLAATTFQLFLEFAYTGKLHLSMATVEKWLEIGVVLKVPVVKDAACRYLKQQTNSDNCMDIIAISEKFDLEEIKRLANRAMCERLIQLSQTFQEDDLPSDEADMSSDDDGGEDDMGMENVESESDGENKQSPAEAPITQSSSRKSPLRPVKQTRYPTPIKSETAPMPRKVETKAALKMVALRPQRYRKPPEPRAPSQRAVSIRHRALKVKQHAINLVVRVKKSYPCNFCEEVYPKHRELQNHYKKDHGKCAKCNKVFRHPDDLVPHLEAHRKRLENPTRGRPYYCPHCGKNCRTNSGLKLHIRTHTGEKPYKCQLCDARFIQSINLKRHVLSNHKDEEPYSCNVCGKKFKVLVYLKGHEVTHSQDRPFQCEACGAMFKRKSDLRSHWRVHNSEKPYACSVCHAKFKTTNDIKAHMLIHNDKKPHVCDQCGQSFKRIGHLNRHVKIHTKTKPFKCEQCGAMFNRKENLRSHERIHSGEFPYTCKVCSAHFRHLSSLKMHEKSHWIGQPQRKEKPQEVGENPGVLVQLLTPVSCTYTTTPMAAEDTRSHQQFTVDSRQVVPLQLQVSSSHLQDLAGGSGSDETSGGIDINLVNLATGTLNHPSHTPSPPPPPPAQLQQQQQLLQQASPNPAALLSLNTTQALAVVQAEAQAQIQAQLNSQIAPLQLTTHLQHGRHQAVVSEGQPGHTLISGTIPSVAVQGTHQFILP